MANNYQYGGWYGGKQWNGQTLGPVGQVIVGNNGGSSNTNQTQGNSIEKENADAVNRYVESLLGEAKGQRDLMLKKIDAEHKLALGNDDAQTAQFLESVADGLEQKIGRIPYDYQKYTARELEDYSRGSGRVTENRDIALKRLAEDEKIAGGLQSEDLNSRGLMAGQDPKDLQGLARQQFDQNVTNPFNRNEEDLTRESGRNLEDLGLNKDRRIQDIRTDTRRGTQDTQNARQFGKESTNLEYDGRMKALERQRENLLRQSKILSGNVSGIQKGILGY